MYLLIDSFESAIYNNTNKVVEALNECLKIAGVTKEQVGLVILTGGTTEIPSVRRRILNIFPEADISEDDKLSSVAQGWCVVHNFYDNKKSVLNSRLVKMEKKSSKKFKNFKKKC